MIGVERKTTAAHLAVVLFQALYNGRERAGGTVAGLWKMRASGDGAFPGDVDIQVEQAPSSQGRQKGCQALVALMHQYAPTL